MRKLDLYLHRRHIILTFNYTVQEKVTVALHFVGETLDRSQAHYRAGAGQLIPLIRGIYADAQENDLDGLILRHAVRMALYLHPRAYLCGPSAIHLGPISDGRLFLGGRYRTRQRIRALEIVQVEAPPAPSVASAAVKDDHGELSVNVSSIPMRFLEAFRTRSEYAAAMDDPMRRDLKQRLLQEYGTPEKASEALWILARANGWLHEAERAERWLKSSIVFTPPSAAQLSLTVAWHGAPIGRLIHDGLEWRWTSEDGALLLPVRQTTPGKLPPFISALLPEGWLERVLKETDERALLRSGKRYMSNIAIVESPSELLRIPADILAARLADHSKHRVFTGTYIGPGRDELKQSFEQNLAELYKRAETPRLSGIQMKAPMHLSSRGELTAAVDKAFTHILKPAGTSGFEALPLVEWFCLELGRAARLDVPTNALVPMPDGMPPALLVERFDIRTGPEDQRLIALEDMCAALDVPTEKKYGNTIERIGRAIRPISTDPDEDIETLFRRALFAWLIADGDMHLKNLSLLKTAAPTDANFTSVRIAPLYDSVTTRVFPGLSQDRMALLINGKDDGLHLRDFRQLARTLGIKSEYADKTILEITRGLSSAANTIAIPEFIPDVQLRRPIENARSITLERIGSLLEAFTAS